MMFDNIGPIDSAILGMSAVCAMPRLTPDMPCSSADAGLVPIASRPAAIPDVSGLPRMLTSMRLGVLAGGVAAVVVLGAAACSGWSGASRPVNMGLPADAGPGAGVTSQQYQAMLAIRASEDQELSIKRLASGMSIKQNGAVQLVDRLETQGLVPRRSCPLDRRSVLVSLTEPGDRLVVSLAEKRAYELLRERSLMVSSLLSLGGCAVSSEDAS